MRWLLDANAVIAMLNDPQGAVARRARKESPADVGVSAIIIHELYYGAFFSARAAQNVALVDALRFTVLPFEKEDARSAGEVRAHLRRKGTPIGPYDVLIAGQAVARKLVLITQNRREFARVLGLMTEDWER
ncbi:MAG TPA: type II toxin-antitoxin system VapC family toxin [Rhizomicrobium sp.]|nr:type II toxin-antitoxin system VapC family toxin [Rhizomicrobium sp.]